ncbi:MAG: hypothetical protein KGM17_09075 [Sphingomonadales bacterium]|nr:hypothetical protein [Sphingomonadales bacterium]
MRPTTPAWLAVACLLAGCGHREPGVYDLPPAEAWQRLRHADLDGFISARGCGVALDIAVDGRSPRSLRWTVRGEGAELVHFGVRLEDSGPGKTRAQIDFPFDPTLTETLTAPSRAPALRQPLQGAVVELVDATLNGRSYDPARSGDDRPQLETCKAKAKPAEPAARPAPVQPQTTFGTPAAGLGNTSLDARPAVLHGGEERVEDQPKPDH